MIVDSDFESINSIKISFSHMKFDLRMRPFVSKCKDCELQKFSEWFTLMSKSIYPKVNLHFFQAGKLLFLISFLFNSLYNLKSVF